MEPLNISTLTIRSQERETIVNETALTPRTLISSLSITSRGPYEAQDPQDPQSQAIS